MNTVSKWIIALAAVAVVGIWAIFLAVSGVGGAMADAAGTGVSNAWEWVATHPSIIPVVAGTATLIVVVERITTAIVRRRGL